MSVVSIILLTQVLNCYLKFKREVLTATQILLESYTSYKTQYDINFFLEM